MKIKNKKYISEIENATPEQLVIIAIELTIINLYDSKYSDEEEEIIIYIKKAQEYILQLASTLDMSYRVSNDLFNVYLYVNKLLNECILEKNMDNIEISIELLENLLESFVIISTLEKKGYLKELEIDETIKNLSL